MGRFVKVGDRLIVNDNGNHYVATVIALSLQSKAMFVESEPDIQFWLPMTAFVDWDERPIEFPIATFLKLTQG